MSRGRSILENSLQPKDIEFALPGLRLAAVEWGEPGGKPVIALHGWLDNAASFDLLAPLISGHRVIAIDAAGHGLSASRSPDAAYNIWQDVADIVGIADRLGCEAFALIGHSRGAAVATLTAGSFPHRVTHLVLLEGGVPMIADPAQAPEMLARSIVDTEKLRHRSGRVFATREQAIEERCRGFTSVTKDAAEVLARRALREVEGGFQWHVDQRLKAPSQLRLSREQAQSFIAAVTAPVLAFFAERSPFANRPEYRELVAGFAKIEVVELAGGHHCHLEGAAELIAARALEFLT